MLDSWEWYEIVCGLSGLASILTLFVLMTIQSDREKRRVECEDRRGLVAFMVEALQQHGPDDD